MALSILEQIDFVNTNIAGGLLDVRAAIKQIAVQYGTVFLRGIKTFDETSEADADAYVNKMVRVCQKGISGDRNTIESLIRVMYVILDQDTTFTKAQVDGATAAQVLGFFESNIPKCFEAVATCEKKEVDAYVALP